MAALSTLLCGTIPAVQSSRTDINEVLKDDSRGASSFRIGKISQALVVVEIVLSYALLVAAGLMIKSVTTLRSIDPGFATASVFTARVGFPATYTDTTSQQQFLAALEQRLAALPGVQAAAISSGLPGAQAGLGGTAFEVDGVRYAANADVPNTRTVSVSPGFFSTLAIPLARGRLFTTSDRQTSLPVGIVTQTFVTKFFPDKDPIGRRVRFGGSASTAPWITIVGIVPDIFGGDTRNPKPPVVFQPLSQAHSNFVYMSTRTAGNPLALTGPVRDAVASRNPDLPIYWPYTLDDAIARPLWFVRVFGTIFMIVGAIALVLAAIGLYAVMAFSVRRRAREMGIRMALGAQARDVIRLIVRQGLVQLVVGLTLGLLLALVISEKGVNVILFDVQPHDPMIFVGVAVVLSVAGMLACLIPATRATRGDPLVALRSD